MNIDIQNIGHYRLTSHGGRSFDLFNRQADTVTTISKRSYDAIIGQMSVSSCKFVEDSYKARIDVA